VIDLFHDLQFIHPHAVRTFVTQRLSDRFPGRSVAVTSDDSFDVENWAHHTKRATLEHPSPSTVVRLVHDEGWNLVAGHTRFSWQGPRRAVDSGMRIAFVEDDEQLRTSVARGLREAGSTVALASHGGEALALIREGGHDVVVLDLKLPVLSGLDVCRTVRDEGNRVPILMLTALDAVEDRIAGLDAGADDYLTKPFDFGELLARLRALTRRHGEAATRLAVGSLVIDTARHRATLGETELTLTAREFDFLSHLARHAGHVVSRADLMAVVWEDARALYSNIIDVYAGRLRRKLESVPGGPVLTTVRGAGFILEPADAPAAPAPPAR